LPNRKRRLEAEPETVFEGDGVVVLKNLVIYPVTESSGDNS
jgi:hypothetical protein